MCRTGNIFSPLALPSASRLHLEPHVNSNLLLAHEQVENIEEPQLKIRAVLQPGSLGHRQLCKPGGGLTVGRLEIFCYKSRSPRNMF